MGVFSWPMTISTLTGEGPREVMATVDTGATHSQVPASILHEVGIVPTRQLEFILANGVTEVRDVGEMRVVVDGFRAVALVVFGEESSGPLMGATTLEGASLAVDPVKRKLVPTDALLL